MNTLKLLCVHGLGDHRDEPWAAQWEIAIRAAFPPDPAVDLVFGSFTYDDIFENVSISPLEATIALGKLLGSGITTGIGSLFGRTRGLSRGLRDSLRWSAGYVVAWIEDEEFKRLSRARVYEALLEHQPDVLVAHSLGTLVTYNALLHEEAQANEAIAALLPRLSYITLGSQLGNAFVRRNLTGGRLVMPAVRQWFHLYNNTDDVFTAPIKILDAPNFRQVDTWFDDPGWMDHHAAGYFGHENTRRMVWTALARQATLSRARAARATDIGAPPKRNPRRRAVLIGINEYPDPALRLEGCVNDVFLISSVLQELGFEPEQIRVCLNKRATAEGILRRMSWLIEDVRPGDELVFYFSGHGAQLPAYNAEELVDHMDETLVPWNFDWTPETCVSDDQIYEFYSQLPYDTRLFMIFDCCHSGGIHRGPSKIRGLSAPDDIRHRTLRWNKRLQMWEERRLAAEGDDFIPAGKGNTHVVTSHFRLGRGSAIRPSEGDSKQLSATVSTTAANQPCEPYLPVILQACQEEQFAYEYRHGATSYGAFSYTLAKIFREQPGLSLLKLRDAVSAALNQLSYQQDPSILGPSAVLNQPILPAATQRKNTRPRKRARKK